MANRILHDVLQVERAACMAREFYENTRWRRCRSLHIARARRSIRANCKAMSSRWLATQGVAPGTSGARVWEHLRGIMTDLLFLLVTIVFFAISVAYTRGLDRI